MIWEFLGVGYREKTICFTSEKNWYKRYLSLQRNYLMQFLSHISITREIQLRKFSSAVLSESRQIKYQSLKSEDSVPDYRFCRKLIFISSSELQGILWPSMGTPARSVSSSYLSFEPTQSQKQSTLAHITTVSSQVIHLYSSKLIFHFEIYFRSECNYSEVDRTSLVRVNTPLKFQNSDLQSWIARKVPFYSKLLRYKRCYYASVPIMYSSPG